MNHHSNEDTLKEAEMKDMKRWIRNIYYRIRQRLLYPERWEYESAAPYTMPQWNEFGRQGWEIIHIDQRYKPFCIYMKRRKR